MIGGGLVLSVTLSPNLDPSTLGAVRSGCVRIARPPSGPLYVTMRQRLVVVSDAGGVCGVGDVGGVGLGVGGVGLGAGGVGLGAGGVEDGQSARSLARTYPTAGELMATQPTAPSSASVTCSLRARVLTIELEVERSE